MINKIYIIGFPKCGSTSLRQWYKEKFPGMIVQSFPSVSLYHSMWSGRMLGECQRDDVLPVIMIRNPYDRLWSAYWWSKMWGKDITFEKFLKRRNAMVDPLSGQEFVDVTSGLHDPVACCDYWRYIKKAATCNPLIIRFEDMIKLDTFPHEAKTDGSNPLGKKELVKPKLDDHHRGLIRDEFILRGMLEVLDGY
jgi:hypothetical protein